MIYVILYFITGFLIAVAMGVYSEITKGNGNAEQCCAVFFAWPMIGIVLLSLKVYQFSVMAIIHIYYKIKKNDCSQGSEVVFKPEPPKIGINTRIDLWKFK